MKRDRLTLFLLFICFVVTVNLMHLIYGQALALRELKNGLKANFETQDIISANLAGLKGQIKKDNENLQKQMNEMSKRVEENRVELDRKMPLPDRGGERGTKRIMEVTAYWEGSCGKAPDDPLYGITASGEYVRNGFIAAGPELEIGTEVYIPYFDKVFTVMDRGSMIGNGCIDVYMEDYVSCIEFGRRQLEVYILN